MASTNLVATAEPVDLASGRRAAHGQPDGDGLDPDEPRTPAWVPLVGLGVFALGGLWFALSDPYVPPASMKVEEPVAAATAAPPGQPGAMPGQMPGMPGMPGQMPGMPGQAPQRPPGSGG